MKATLTILTLVTTLAGFGLVGNAVAQPNPPEAAGETSGGDSAANEKPDPAPEQPSAEPEKEEAKGGEEAEAASGEEEKVEPPSGAVEQAKGLYGAMKSGNWTLVFALAAMLLGSLLRMAMKMKWKFWDSKAGGYTVAVVMGLATLGAGVFSAGTFSVDLLLVAVTTTLAAMGMHGPAKALKEKAKPASV